MIGAIIGDIVGSIYEFDNIKKKEFKLFDFDYTFTDDTVMTIAVGKALSQHNRADGTEAFKKNLIKTMHEFGNLYPYAGYGGRFAKWIENEETAPYGSFGNGSAMRVSAVGWWALSLEEAEEYAKASAEVTHNHPEGIKGAQAVAGAIYLAKMGATKEVIKEYIEKKYYALDFTLDEIRPTYKFEVSCQKSVPQAIEAFLESKSFEDTLRNAISIGGDSDTIAAIAGSIAETYYGVDEELRETALSYLDENLLNEYENIKTAER